MSDTDSGSLAVWDPATPATPAGLRLPPGWLIGLLVPAEPDRACALLMLRDAASSLSEALGGGLLDERAVDGTPAHRCWLYLDESRRSRLLPPNRRLERLAAALGWPRDPADGWCGPALVTGRDLRWADRDVPSVVVAAALAADDPAAAVRGYRPWEGVRAGGADPRAGAAARPRPAPAEGSPRSGR
jgi:hypothetical protein